MIFMGMNNQWGYEFFIRSIIFCAVIQIPENAYAYPDYFGIEAAKEGLKGAQTRAADAAALADQALTQRDEKIRIRDEKLRKLRRKLEISARQLSVFFAHRRGATSQYLADQEILRGKYFQLQDLYFSSEGSKDLRINQMKTALGAKVLAKTPNDLILPVMTLCQTGHLEKSMRSKLKLECKELAARMLNSHQSYEDSVLKASPRPGDRLYGTASKSEKLVAQLDQMRALLETHEREVSKLAALGGFELGYQSDRMIREAAREETLKDVKHFEIWKGDMGFLDFVNGLVNKKKELSTVKKGDGASCISRLSPYLKFYEEIQTYRNICSDLDSTPPGSPFRTGCAVMKSLLVDAEVFFSRTAMSRASMTLIRAKVTAPPELAPWVSALEALMAVGSGATVAFVDQRRIAQMIEAHDELLSRWVELEGQENCSVGSGKL